ncbi:TetR/AcrR family transcriptional regulator [Cellulomonas sp.]|uniref:TetR/AcrR family transcriptional regulator n=1 Tax=Cellulomonas sp. TaxID=40001 RepID=UPI0025881551|nr:TetR/AcrR family transcriptional regulator [Cellulomonas sp.]MCR6689014.1 TetR/AcrR family transcriptional regulator [Cellulomonas sp.]
MSPITPGPSTTRPPAGAAAGTPGGVPPRVTARPAGAGGSGARGEQRPQVRPAPRPEARREDPFAVDGRSARWADHREARRAELVRIARRTVHHRGPDVSMEEIATAAGTSKSIVYRYFSDKTGLQIAVAEAVVLQIQGALEGVLRVAPTPREGLRAMVAVYLEMIESSPHVYAFVTRDGSVESGGPLGHFLDSVTHLVALPFAREIADRDEPAGTPDDEGAPLVVAQDGPVDGPDDRSDDPAVAARIALAEAWAAGAVGFVRGAGEWWMAHREQPGIPDRTTLTAQVAAWLWAGPVGLLAREHSTRTPWEIR